MSQGSIPSGSSPAAPASAPPTADGIDNDVRPALIPALVPALARLPGHLLWRAAARVDQTLTEALPTGSDIHTYAALVALADEVTLSQQELADRTGVSRTTMVRVAGALTAAGLVERVRNPHDRRSYALTRTASGAEVASEWEQHAGTLEDRLVGDLDRTEVIELHDLMEQLAAADLHEHTPPRLRASIGFLVTQVHARKHRDFSTFLEPLGIAPRDFGTLTGLRATGPVSQSELARMLGVSSPTVVQIVDDLEHNGLVERRRDEADRRTQLVHLTPSGRRRLQQATQLAARRDPGLLGGLDDAATERLIDLLGRFVTAA